MASGENVMEISGAMKPEENLCGDRFSSLPDAIAYCILSFVNVDDFCRLMLVSKRWNKLCFSSPCLSMVNNSFTHDLTCRAQVDRFLGYYFSRRAQSGAEVQQLRIVWSFRQAKPLELAYGRGKRKRVQKDCDDDDPVFTCLDECVKLCNPEHVELNLILREGVRYKGLLSRYIVSSIRNLVFSMNNSGFIFPASLLFPSRIEKLTLKSVQICCKSFDHLITHDFPKLKLLRLYDCTGVEELQICNDSVECVEIINEKPTDLCYLTLGCLKLTTLFLTWYPESSTGAHLYLCVPQIEHFELEGFPLRYYEFQIYQHVKSATIHCTLPSGRGLDEYRGYYMFSVVESVKKAKSLRLHAKSIEILSDQLKRINDPYSLEGVETLHIDFCYLTDDDVPAIASILKMMPDLKNIHVSSSKAKAHTPLEVSCFWMDYWEAQDLKFVQQLETATVEIRKEQGNAAELVKYFAKHGKHLGSLKVICPSAMVSAVSGQSKFPGFPGRRQYVYGVFLGRYS